MTNSPSLDVVTFGHAIVDVLSQCDDSLIAAHGLTKGTMALVEPDRAAAIYDSMGPGIEVSGGSAANTAAGVASLGGRAAFVGKVAPDDLGTIFTHDLRAAGVTFATPPRAEVGVGTARSLILVTPDAERTMNTSLGVAAELSPDDVDEDQVAAAELVYLEGYLIGVPSAEKALQTAVAAARRHGTTVVLSLSDPMWVQLNRDAFLALLPEVDVVLANEAEALELTGAASLDEAVAALGVAVAGITRGADGAVVADNDVTVPVPATPVAHVVDTTGAGDLFAAGFCFGLARGLPLPQCGRLGVLAAAEVIAHVGARPQTSLAALAAEAGLLPP